MALDMLDRLCLDPGTRTIGELIQEREWAAVATHPSDASALPRKRGHRLRGSLDFRAKSAATFYRRF